jgi:ketose-bisphosphate aldolase
MPLVAPKMLIEDALKRKYALGYFESWNMESLDAVIEAAEECKSPVIIGFGGVLVEREWFNRFGINYYAVLGKAAARNARVPVGLILNEVQTFAEVRQGILSGFNMVSMDSSHLSYRENVALTKKIVSPAHRKRVAVEAELGRLPSGTKGVFEEGESSLTDPDEAERFVRETNVNLLAVSLGNVHVLMKGKASIDLELLSKIRERVNVPLVLHGGSGLPDRVVAEAIALGIAKINVGSILRKAFFEGMKNAIARSNKDYWVIVQRSRNDAISQGRLAMKREVKRLMKVYRSCGKA